MTFSCMGVWPSQGLFASRSSLQYLVRDREDSPDIQGQSAGPVADGVETSQPSNICHAAHAALHLSTVYWIPNVLHGINYMSMPRFTSCGCWDHHHASPVWAWFSKHYTASGGIFISEPDAAMCSCHDLPCVKFQPVLGRVVIKTELMYSYHGASGT